MGYLRGRTTEGQRGGTKVKHGSSVPQGGRTAAISQVFAHTITDNCGFHLAVFVGVQLWRWLVRML